jgi:hypothetical protein
VADRPKHRLTDTELDEAFAQAHGSLRLTAALSELKEVRPLVAAAKAWRATHPVDGNGSTASWVRAHRALERAIDDLLAMEHDHG